jgi:predicted amidohydrolase
VSEPVIAAAVQMTSGPDVAENLARAASLVRRAVARGAGLVVLPENFAYFGDEVAKASVAERFAPGELPAGPIGLAACALSLETRAWIVWGGAPELTDAPSSRTHNTSFVTSPRGELVGRYRKAHLFDVSLPDGSTYCESRSVAPGADAVVVDGPFGVIGLSICYDVRFPELYRALVSRGATLLTVPAAFTVPTGKDHWHVLLRARAIESQCYVIAAAQWGAHPNGRQTYGHALIADPWGTVIAECADGEGFALAELDPARVAQVRAALPSLAHRVFGLDEGSS